MKKILTIGTFDILHQGHFNLVNKMIELCGAKNTVIALSSDEWNLIKNRNYFNSFKTRKENLNFIYPEITIVEENSVSAFSAVPEIIKKYKIDIVLLGEYQTYLKKFLQAKSIEVDFLEQKRFIGVDSSSLREKLIENARKFGIRDKEFLDIIKYEKLQEPLPRDFEILEDKKSNELIFFGNYVYKKCRYTDKLEREQAYRDVFNIEYARTPQGIIYKKIFGRNLCSNNISDVHLSQICNLIKNRNISVNAILSRYMMPFIIKEITVEF